MKSRDSTGERGRTVGRGIPGLQVGKGSVGSGTGNCRDPGVNASGDEG